jgi:Leucine-rich repeat (LRR) protein/phosphotransferase system HPr-like phosphotransfer protein
MAILLFSFTAKITAQDANNDGFHDGDIAALKKILTDNLDCTLSWTGTDYGSWSDISWGFTTPKRVSALSLTDKNISKLDLTVFTSLRALYVNNNKLTTLSLTENEQLQTVKCSNNNISAIDLTQLRFLSNLQCNNNNLSELNITNCTKLKYIHCTSNNLSSLNLTNNTDLERLSCSFNKIKSLDLSSNAKLTNLSCTDNEMTQLNITGTANLDKIYCHSNNITTLDISGSSKLTYLSCADCKIESLNVSSNTLLATLIALNNNISSISLPKGETLTSIFIDNNKISSIDFSETTGIQYVKMNNNNLTSIDISNNTDIRNLEISNNSISLLKTSDSHTIGVVKCKQNRLKFTDIALFGKPYIFEYSDQADITDNHTIYGGTEIDLSGQEDIDGTKSVYKWYRDNALLNGITSSKYTPTVTGVYKCKITNTKYPELTLSTGNITVELKNNHAPVITTNSLNIPENSVVNSLVGTVTITDNDPVQNPLTFTLTDNTGTFRIDENTGVIKVKSATLNHETAESIIVNVSVNDGSNTVDKDITINIDNVNEKPEDIQLSSAEIAENMPANTEIATINISDVDKNDVLTATLADALPDNIHFKITDNKLIAKAQFDREAKKTYTIKIKATDKEGLFITKIFTVTVTNVNEKPENLQLSAKEIAENEVIGTEIGLLSATDIDENDALTITLDGDNEDNEDNDQFEVKENKLLSKALFNKEIKDTYKVKVKATDKGGLSVSETYTITVTNVNEKPDNLQLSAKEIAENEAIGTEIGLLSATDVDENDEITISLDGSDNDNAWFDIKENKLISKAKFDKETKDTYVIKVKVSDKEGLFSTEEFTISVTDVNEKPENLQLSASEIAENATEGTEIGVLSATDIDENDVVTITLDGDNEDNDQFEVKENKLISKASFDFETKKIYTVKIKATDKEGLFITREFTISVTDQNEAPVSIKANKSSIAENSAVGTFVTEIIAIDNDKDDEITLTIADNDNFDLDNNRVITKKVFNYEDANTFTVTITATDKSGLTLERKLDIAVSNVNEAPYNLKISNFMVYTGISIGTEVAKVSADDVDENDDITYTIKDNKYFEIKDNIVRTKADLEPIKLTIFGIQITATDNGGLTVTKEFTFDVKEDRPTNINSEQDIDINIYPNPVSDIVNIKANEVIESIDILTVSGRIVYSKVVNSEQIRVNTNNIQSGVYIIRIRTENSTVTKKIIIRH